MRQRQTGKVLSVWGLMVSATVILLTTSVRAAEPLKVGLVAALSGQFAKAGEGITRGLTIAMDEINRHGGVLGGRKIELVRRDDESNPSKGQVAALELIHKEKVTVLFGGIDSPVSLAIVPLVNKAKIPFMGVWAAATNITRNGADLGCRTFLSCISKGFGDFWSQLWRLRTGQLSSAF